MAESETNYETKVVPRLTEIAHWVRTGSPEREVCERVGISYTAWCNYKKSYPEFRLFLTNARKQSQNSIENALYKRATGYDYVEIKTVETGDPDKSSTTTTTKHMPADVIAAIFILKNIDKGRWSDKQVVDQTIRTPQTMADIVTARRERQERILEGNN